jgi:lysozyme family protein
MLASRSAATAQEKLAVLNCRRLPGRLNTSETALLLGFHEHDMAPLVAARLLVPLGKPAANAPKYFAAVAIAECAADSEWLSQATKALAKHWLRKNQRKQLPAGCFL